MVSVVVLPAAERHAVEDDQDKEMWEEEQKV